MFLRRRRILRRGLVGVVLWVGRRGRREGVRRVSLGHGRGALRRIGIRRRIGRVNQVGEIHDARYENLFEEWAGCDDDHPFPCPSMRRPPISFYLFGDGRAHQDVAARAMRCGPGNCGSFVETELCRDGLQQLDSPSARQAFVVRVRGVVRMRNGATGDG
jgi:hypothetical protein